MPKRIARETGTYVALTSSFAGTGGIVEAMVEGVVACSGTLFGGDFLRERNFILEGVLELSCSDEVGARWSGVEVEVVRSRREGVLEACA
jgi:hypothetical protein